jgi:DNA-binding CsgD family transcriptional regulator
VTEPVLRAVLDVDDARTGFDALRALPFVEVDQDGLLLHDVVRDTVASELALRDPDTRRTYRLRAARHLGGRPVTNGNLWRHTADLWFLVENPVIRYSCFPTTRPDHVVEPARPDDDAAVTAIIERHEPAALLQTWWQRHPNSFAVARRSDGTVDAFVQIIELSAADPALLATDPVARPWLDHLAACPPAPGDAVLLMRRWLGRDSGELRSPAVAACWLDVKRVYMQLRPRLRRLYSAVVDLPHLGPIFLPLGFAPVGAPVALGGTLHQAVWLDFGPGSVDGWLGRLVQSEAEGSAEPDVLSPRELEVLRHVAAGRSNRRIGTELFISEKTASRHVSNILAKLGVRTRTEAARIAAERGLAAG